MQTMLTVVTQNSRLPRRSVLSGDRMAFALTPFSIAGPKGISPRSPQGSLRRRCWHCGLRRVYGGYGYPAYSYSASSAPYSGTGYGYHGLGGPVPVRSL